MLKAQLSNFVPLRQFDQLTKETKLLALNSDLKALYHKVVPPAASMEEMGKEMIAEVGRLTEVVYNFDSTLSIKANR